MQMVYVMENSHLAMDAPFQPAQPLRKRGPMDCGG